MTNLNANKLKQSVRLSVYETVVLLNIVWLSLLMLPYTQLCLKCIPEPEKNLFNFLSNNVWFKLSFHTNLQILYLFVCDE